MTEDGITDLFERAVRDLDPPVRAIVLQAEQRGRRVRARRRAWMAAGGLVVASLAGTSLATGVPLAHSGGGPVTAGAASRHPGSKHAGTSHPSLKPSARRSAPKSWAVGAEPKLARRYWMPQQQMLHLLRSLLPAGSTLSKPDPLAWHYGTLELDYNDGHGAVDIQLAVDPTAMYAPLSCPKPLWPNEGPRPAGALPESCTMRTLPDGSIERDSVYNADVKSYYAYNVDVERPDGVTVDIDVGNGLLHGWPQVDRARPPGSMAAWVAVVENPAWHLKKGWHLEH
jgi:hypothetical protein